MYLFYNRKCSQVDLDSKAAGKITDDNGDISKEDFVKIAQDYKLLDFSNIMAGDTIKQGSKKQSKSLSNNNNNNNHHVKSAGLQGGKVTIILGIYSVHFITIE